MSQLQCVERWAEGGIDGRVVAVPIRDSLQTKALSFGELLANGRRYRVPAFQRNYSWDQTEWDDLWNDVVAADQLGRDHYLGAVVLRRSAPTPDLFEVIDGQQRLTTLSILCLAILAEFHVWAENGVEREANQERADLLRERLIAPRDPSSLTYQSRLELNRADNDFYQSALVNGEAPVNERRLSKSSQALWSAWRYFREKVHERFGAAADGASMAKFVDQTLQRRLVFIEIVVDDEAAAYTVLETLNARGVALGTADLVKNYLFAKVATGGVADLEEMQRRWDRLIAIVPLDQIADLLHHHSNTEGLNVSKRDVFRRIRDRVTSKRDAFEYVAKVTAAADWYAALLDPNDERWHGFAEAKSWVRVLSILKAEQFRPAALAAAPQLADRPDELAALFRVFALYTFRATVVLRVNTGDIYRAWNRAAVAARERGGATATAIARVARAIYGEDPAFEAAFAELSVPAAGARKKLLRYVLATLESEASGRPVDWETDPFTIEHVMPEAYDESSEISLDVHERFVHRIGNYLPLEASKNREAASLPFVRKVEVYSRSAYALPRQLEGEVWSPESIRRRSSAYAKRAAHLWRVDV